jgi:hypothetical protein
VIDVKPCDPGFVQHGLYCRYRMTSAHDLPGSLAGARDEGSTLASLGKRDDAMSYDGIRKPGILPHLQ